MQAAARATHRRRHDPQFNVKTFGFAERQTVSGHENPQQEAQDKKIFKGVKKPQQQLQVNQDHE